MKLLLLSCAFLLGAFVSSEAQTIESKKVFAGYTFSQNGSKMTSGELYRAMIPESQSAEIMQKSKSNNGIARILAGAGALGVGLPLGSSIAGGDPNWAFAIAGGALIVTSIPISAKAGKQAKQAVNLHNASLSSSITAFKPDFYVVSNQNGLGLSVRF